VVLYVGVGIALVIQVALCVAAASERHIPAYLAVMGPLVVLVAARNGFADWDPSMPVEQVAAELTHAASVGPIIALMGVGAFVVGVGLRWKGEEQGAPSLAQMGAVTFGVGLVWKPWLLAQATLWQAGAMDLAVAHEAARDAVYPWGMAGLVSVAIGWGSTSVWGYLRYQWRGLGEGLSAAVLVALTLSTGRPAGMAIRGIYGPMRDVCEVVEREGVSLPSGTTHPVYAEVVRMGPDGLERYDSEWVSWTAKRPQRVLWLAAPQTTVGEVRDAAAALPEGSEVLIAGAGGPVTEGPWLFRQHPVLKSQGCWAWPLPGPELDGTPLADALSVLPR